MQNTANQEEELITDEILAFVKSKEKIASATLQIEFRLGYMKANRIIQQLLKFKIISEPVVDYGAYIVNKNYHEKENNV